MQDRRHQETGGPSAPPPSSVHFFCKTKEKRKGFKTETIKKLLSGSKCYCFSHSRGSKIQNFFFGQSYWPTILSSVLWTLHFEILFASLLWYRNKSIPIGARIVSYRKGQWRGKNRYNSCFGRRSPEQSSMGLLPIHMKFDWKEVFAAAKISTSVTNLLQVGNSWMLFVLLYSKICYDEWFFRWTCFFNGFLTFFFSQTVLCFFYHDKKCFIM